MTASTAAAPELDEAQRRTAEVRDFARRLCGGMSDEQRDWKPSAERWSVGECLEHLVRVNEAYLAGMEAAAEKGRAAGRLGDGPFRYGFLDRWFVSMVEPPPKKRLKAPKSFSPARSASAPDAPDALVRTLDRLEAFERDARGLDLQRIKVPSPAFRLLRFSLGTAIRILNEHTMRHLLQAEAVTREPGFPEGAAS